MKLVELVHMLAGPTQFTANPDIRHVVIDSRLAGPGDVFVALRGEQTDGHKFVAEAFKRGALAALVEREVAADCAVLDLRAGAAALAQVDLPVCLRVDNTLAALQQWGGAWRAQLPVRVIGVTGSVGKSSTKELIAAVLARRFGTYKNAGNLNNEIGLPLSLLEIMPQVERAVLEMGMYALGEIALLCKLAQPVMGVITNIGPVHLERLGSMEAIAQAKSELVQALPTEGVAILNYDDPLVQPMAQQTSARVLFYGLDPRADIWADNIESMGLEGIAFDLHYRAEMLHVHVPLLGRHSVHTSLRAAAVGLAEGLAWEEIMAGLQDPRAALRLIAAPGPGGSTILDDTYNASPASTIAALNLLADMPGRKIAVLGDMLELGYYEEAGHRLVGCRAASVADILITVGERGKLIGAEAQSCGMHVIPCETNAQAIEHLRKLMQAGDFILVKGSHGMHMEQIVMALSKG
jgi:UDP-N-acetylmuramoyl-tripeptide--D-alanyl-D-alanine ligase